jgi:hypothetical protein
MLPCTGTDLTPAPHGFFDAAKDSATVQGLWCEYPGLLVENAQEKKNRDLRARQSSPPSRWRVPSGGVLPLQCRRSQDDPPGMFVLIAAPDARPVPAACDGCVHNSHIKSRIHLPVELSADRPQQGGAQEAACWAIFNPVLQVCAAAHRHVSPEELDPSWLRLDENGGRA